MRKFDKIARKKLGELLVDAGLITFEAVDEAIGEQKRTGRLLGEILVSQGLVKEKDIAVVLTRQFQLPFLSLADYRLTKSVVELLPAAICHQFGVIPLDQFGNVMIVAVSQNPSLEAIEAIRAASGCEISPFVAIGSEVQRYLDELAPYDAKAIAAERKQAASEGPKGWADVFDRGDESATGIIPRGAEARSTETPPAGAPGRPAAAKVPVPEPPKRKARTGAETSASALAIFDIGDQRVTQRMEKPKEKK